MWQVILIGVLVFCSGGHAQEDSTATRLDSTGTQASSPSRDPVAVELLAQSLAVSGWATFIPADFVATGTLTYHWQEDVSGTATIRGRGIDQFRMDVELPKGTRSWATVGNKGWIRTEDGQTILMPLHAAANIGQPTLPYPLMSAAVAQNDIGVSYVGTELLSGRIHHKIRILRRFARHLDPSGIKQATGGTDILLDGNSHLPTLLQRVAFGVDSPQQGYPYAVVFSDYRTEAGIAIPFLVVELVSGQKGWTLSLRQLRLNQSLSDAAFEQANP